MRTTSTFGYDAVGNRTRFTNGRGQAFWTTYTPWNLPESQVEPATTAHPDLDDRTFSVTYDKAGRLATSRSPGGVSVAASYDDAGRLTRMAGTGAEADTADRVFGYDEAGRITSASGTGGTNRFVYDDRENDNLTSKTTVGFGGAGTRIANTYGYDLAGRLTSWNNGVARTEYGYAAAGNRTKAGGATASYDERNRLTATQTSSGSTSYRYTARGTLSETVTPTGTLRTKVDAFGRVVSQEASSGKTSVYSYDGLGRLTGDQLAYTGVGDTLAADGSAKYTRDPSGTVLGAATGTNRSLVWTDEHSDVVGQFTDTESDLSGSRVFDPWGTVLSAAGMLGALGYQSAFTDTDTGRVEMGSRWYDPGSGRFDTRDTANVSAASGDSITANRYAYANANPLTNVDPAGTWSISGAIKSVAKTVSKAASAVVDTVVSVARAVYTNVILPVVNAVVNVVKAVVNTVVGAVRSAVNWVASKASQAAAWVSQQTAAARAWVARKAEAARQRAARA